VAGLHDMLETYVGNGSVPGAVGLIACGERTEVAVAGSIAVDDVSMARGQGWGFGGSVDIATIDPWNVPGRYGWVGGTGTSAHITPSTGMAAILLTQVAADSPIAPKWMRDFWRYAADTC